MPSGMTVQIIMLVGLIALMYFLLIRPQKKRDKQINDMRNSVKVGDEIVTIGGIYGKVVKVRDERLTIMVGADKTKIEVTRWAISKIENASTQKGSSKPEKSEDKDEAESKRKPKPKKMMKKAEPEAPVEEVSEAPVQPEIVDVPAEEVSVAGDSGAEEAPVAAEPAEAAAAEDPEK